MSQPQQDFLHFPIQKRRTRKATNDDALLVDLPNSRRPTRLKKPSCMSPVEGKVVVQGRKKTKGLSISLKNIDVENKPLKTFKNKDNEKKHHRTSFRNVDAENVPLESFKNKDAKNKPHRASIITVDEENNALQNAKNLCATPIKSSPESSIKFTHLSSASAGRSPLKAMCQNIFKTPEKASIYNRTPVKRINFDSFSSPKKNNLIFSPPTLISRLSLSPSKSPRKTIGLCRPDIEIYQRLKQSLANGSDANFVGREAEKTVLKEFLENHLLTSIPGSLYISGAPGTGKTASVTAIIEEMKIPGLKKVYLNCMNHKSTKAIFSQIAIHFGIKTSQSEYQILKCIEMAVTSSKPVLLILDEIDQLSSKNQSVLYTIFEWPSLANSKLVLVGIANMLDLTDRILPRLQGNPHCKPRLLHFPPYTKPEIINIINARITAAGIGNVEVIKPSAVSFLAGKIAAVAGDARKALDVCRRAVELSEMQVKKQAKITIAGNKSPVKSVKQVDIGKIHALFNEVYGSRINSDVNNTNSISVQQEVLICSLLLMLKYAKSKTITIGQLHEVYSKVCQKQKLPAVDQSEFLSLCFLLEARGILEVRKMKEPRNSKVFLRLSQEESEQTLGDKNLMANILEDKESLGKLRKTKE